LPRKILVIEGKPTFIDNKECRPAVETAPMRWKRYDSTAGAAPVPIKPSVSNAWTEASPRRSNSASSKRPEGPPRQ
jgi:hypothetical protein